MQTTSRNIVAYALCCGFVLGGCENSGPPRDKVRAPLAPAPAELAPASPPPPPPATSMARPPRLMRRRPPQLPAQAYHGASVAPPAIRDPGQMDPGALQASPEELRRRARGRGPGYDWLTQRSTPTSPGVADEAPEPQAPDNKRESPEFRHTLLQRLDGLQDQSSQEAQAAQLDELKAQLQQLQALQGLAEDGELSPSEVQQITKQLRSQGVPLPVEAMLKGHGAIPEVRSHKRGL